MVASPGVLVVPLWSKNLGTEVSVQHGFGIRNGYCKQPIVLFEPMPTLNV